MASNYEQLYDQSRKLFLTFDQEAMISWFGLEHDREALYFHILGQPVRLDRANGIITCGGKRVGFDEACAAYDVLSRAEKKPKLSGRWVSIVDLGGNTASYHAEKLSPRIKALEGRTEELRNRCRSWGGMEQRQGDVSFVVPLFDFFPVWVQYWEGDEEFPPKFNCLWDANTLDFMFYETTWYARGYLFNRLSGEEGQL